MKTLPRFLIRLTACIVFIFTFYSFTNFHLDGNAPDARADSVTKKGIILSGSQEVPAVTGGGTGTLDVSYDKTTKILRYNASWTGLSDSATMMHFHGPAEKGANAGVVFPIRDYTPGRSGTASGTVTLDEVKLKEADLLSGKWYYNIHTKTHPGGEIRGQVEF